MLIMLVIDIGLLVCDPEISLVHHDAANLRPPTHLDYFDIVSKENYVILQTVQNISRRYMNAPC